MNTAQMRSFVDSLEKDYLSSRRITRVKRLVLEAAKANLRKEDVTTNLVPAPEIAPDKHTNVFSSMNQDQAVETVLKEATGTEMHVAAIWKQVVRNGCMGRNGTKVKKASINAALHKGVRLGKFSNPKHGYYKRIDTAKTLVEIPSTTTVTTPFRPFI